MKKVFTLLLLLIFGFSFAQDVVLSQKRGGLIYFNPALVGTESNQAININHQLQWPNDNWEHISSSINTNYNLKNNWGLGVSALNDRGTIRLQRNLRINTNYQKNIDELIIKGGLSLVVFQNRLDLAKAQFLYPGDTLNEINSKSNVRLGLDLGGAIFYKGLFANAALFQLNSPKLVYGSFSDKIHRRISAGAGYGKKLNELSLAGLVNYTKQGDLEVVQGQLSSTYKFVRLGVGINNSMEEKSWYTAMTGLQFAHFTIAYSLQMDFESNRITVNENTHQITASWFIKPLKEDDKLSGFMQTVF